MTRARPDMSGVVLRKDRLPSKGEAASLGLRFTPATDEEIKTLAAAKAADGKLPDGYLAGWASTPDVDSYGHVVMPNAFAGAIKTRGLQGPNGIKFLIGHDWDKVGGAITVLEYRGGKLWIEAQLNLNISYAKDAYEATKSAGGMSFSVGFRIQDYEFKEDPNTGEDLLIINRADLFEVSLVPFPANEQCGMEFMKSAPGSAPEADEACESVSEFERQLVVLGLVKSRREAHKVVDLVKASAGLFAKAPPPPPAPKPAPAPVAPLIGDDVMSKLAKQVADLRSAADALAAKK